RRAGHPSRARKRSSQHQHLGNRIACYESDERRHPDHSTRRRDKPLFCRSTARRADRGTEASSRPTFVLEQKAPVRTPRGRGDRFTSLYSCYALVQVLIARKIV